MKFLHPAQLLYLHKRIMELSGGEPALRDSGLFESAVYRPRASFGGSDLYPDLFSKAAALGHSLVKNHPFVDGNKRAGLEAVRLFLRLNGQDLTASEDDKVAFALRIAQDPSFDEPAIAAWLKKRCRPAAD